MRCFRNFILLNVLLFNSAAFSLDEKPSNPSIELDLKSFNKKDKFYLEDIQDYLNNILQNQNSMTQSFLASCLVKIKFDLRKLDPNIKLNNTWGTYVSISEDLYVHGISNDNFLLWEFIIYLETEEGKLLNGILKYGYIEDYDEESYEDGDGIYEDADYEDEEGYLYPKIKTYPPFPCENRKDMPVKVKIGVTIGLVGGYLMFIPKFSTVGKALSAYGLQLAADGIYTKQQEIEDREKNKKTP